jgi:FkbM family methyltransferase
MNKLIATSDDVRHAYRLILGCEPDAAGSQAWIETIEKRALAPADLADYFLKSDEYLSGRQLSDSLIEVHLGEIKLFPRRGDKAVGGVVGETGSYEPWVIGAFVASLRRGAVVLDVGANIGVFALTASIAVGDDGRVIAVEPIPRNVRSLHAAIAANGVRNITVLPFAASNREDVAPVSHTESSSTSNLRPDGYSDLYVPTARLDPWLKDLSRIDVIKMDIDGFEPLAIEGLAQALVRSRPILFMEFFPAGIEKHARRDPWEFARILYEYGEVTILDRSGSPQLATGVEQIRQHWLAVDSAVKMNGAMHLDLKVVPRS